MRIAVLGAALCWAILLGRADSGQLLGAFDNHISRIAPTTGALERIADTGLDTRVNYQFVIDSENHLGYEIGRVDGVDSLSKINLITGTSQVTPYSGPRKIGAYKGQLFAVSRSDIFRVDSDTGVTTPFGSTGFDSDINFQFTIDSDNDVAYLLGQTDGQRLLSTIDLTTGIPTATAPIDLIPGFAVYKGQLLVTDGLEISSFDPTTGSTTILTATGLDTGINFQFAVDSDLDTAYLLGRSGNTQSLCSVDLLTRRSKIVPLEGLPTLQAYLIPLPPVAMTIGELEIERYPQGVVLRTPTAFGRAIGAEYSADLTGGSWIQLGNFFETDGVATFVDPDPTRLALPGGHYRAFLRPLRD